MWLSNISQMLGKVGIGKLLAVGLLVVGLPVAVYLSLNRVGLWPKAAGGAALSFSPSSASLPPDKQLSVMVNSGVEQVVFTRVEFTFDPGQVRLTQELATSPLFGNVIVKTSMAEANGTGRVIIALGVAPEQLANAPTGSFELAKATFGAVGSSGTTPVNFDIGASQVVNINATALGLTATGASLSLGTGTGARLFFNVAIPNLPPDRTYGLSVDAGLEQVAYVDAVFTFDPAKVQLAAEIAPTQFLKTVVLKTTMAEANSTGRARVVLALAPADANNPPTGTFAVAMTTWRAVSTTVNDSTSLVTDGSSSQVVNKASAALPVAGSAAPLMLNSQATATPTATRTPTPPTVTQTPIPTPGLHPVSWSTGTVDLTADDFYIVANGVTYFPTGTLSVRSDPGDANYTTLEVIWLQGGEEMRLFMYFNADATDWWAYEIRTYGANDLGKWIYYKNGAPYFQRQLGETAVEPSVVLTNDPGFGEAGEIHFTNLQLRAFTAVPTITPGGPTATLVPSPTPTGAVGGLTFKLRLQGITERALDQTVRMELRTGSDVVRLFTNLTLINDDSGVYTGRLPEVVPADVYDVYVKTRSHLQRRISGVNLRGGQQSVDWSGSESQQLLVGDVNDTNTITVEDVVAVLSEYTDFSVPAAAGSPVDVNADGRITIDDVALALINFTDFSVAGD